MKENRIVLAGSFCWNRDCPDYGLLDQGNIIKYGRTGKGAQRLKCKNCMKVFVENKGTVFYGRHHKSKEILECLAMVAERNSLASIHRVKLAAAHPAASCGVFIKNEDRHPQQHAPEKSWYLHVPADPPNPEVVEAAPRAEVSTKPPASKGADDHEGEKYQGHDLPELWVPDAADGRQDDDDSQVGGYLEHNSQEILFGGLP